MSATSTPAIHTGKKNETHTRHLADQEAELTLESGPSGCGKLLILCAIVVFVLVLTSSVPTLLSAHTPRETSPRPKSARQRSASPDSSSLSLERNVDRVLQCLPRLDFLVFGEHEVAKVLSEVSNRDASAQEKPATLSVMSDISKQPSPSPSPITTPLKSSSGQPQDSNTGALYLMQHLRVGTLLLASFKVAYRTGMWVLGGSYQLVRLMVAKPLEIGIAVVETPYIITRDVCKAFLPVYSFFTVAAVIGVIVGGSAMWIAHILISAIGADRDKSVMFIQSQTPPHLRLNDSAQVFRQRGKNTSKQPPQIAAASLSTGGLCNLLPRSKHGAGLQSSAAFRKGLGALSYDEDDDEEEEDDNEDEDDEDDGNWR